MDAYSIAYGYLPTAQKPVRYSYRVLRVLLRIDGGLRDYARRRRIIANPPKPKAKSERAEGSGTIAIRKPAGV